MLLYLGEYMIFWTYISKIYYIVRKLGIEGSGLSSEVSHERTVHTAQLSW